MTLNVLLKGDIKLALEAYFTILINRFTQMLENIMDQRVQVLFNIQTKMMHQLVNQMTQENTQF